MSLDKKIENLIQVELNKHEVDNDLSFTLTEIGRIQLDINLVVHEVADKIREIFGNEKKYVITDRTLTRNLFLDVLDLLQKRVLGLLVENLENTKK